MKIIPGYSSTVFILFTHRWISRWSVFDIKTSVESRTNTRNSAGVHVRGCVKSITQDAKLDVRTIMIVELQENDWRSASRSSRSFRYESFLASATRSSPPLCTCAWGIRYFTRLERSVRINVNFRVRRVIVSPEFSTRDDHKARPAKNIIARRPLRGDVRLLLRVSYTHIEYLSRC